MQYTSERIRDLVVMQDVYDERIVDAIKTKDLTSVRAVIEKDQDIFDYLKLRTSVDYVTPAITYGNIEIVKYFLQIGRSINYENAIEQAITKKNALAVKAIIKRGYNPIKYYKDGLTILDFAVKDIQLDIVALLFNLGCDKVTHVDNLFKNGYLNETNSTEDARKLFTRMMMSKCKRKLNPHEVYDEKFDYFYNTVNKSYDDPVDCAVRRFTIQELEYYISKGSDVTIDEIAKDPYYLFQAIKYNTVDMVKYLLDHGADPNAKYEGDMTVLEACIKIKNWDLVQHIIERGAEVKFTDKAIVRIMKDLVDYSVDNKDWIQYWNLAVFEKHRGNTIISQTGRSILFYAVEKRSPVAVKYLIKRGVEVNKQDEYGYSALHDAVWNEDLEMLKLLISLHGRKKVKDYKYHDNLLHHAARTENKEIVDYLIEEGLDPLEENLLDITAKEIMEEKEFAKSQSKYYGFDDNTLLNIIRFYKPEVVSLFKVKIKNEKDGLDLEKPYNVLKQAYSNNNSAVVKMLLTEVYTAQEVLANQNENYRMISDLIKLKKLETIDYFITLGVLDNLSEKGLHKVIKSCVKGYSTLMLSKILTKKSYLYTIFTSGLCLLDYAFRENYKGLTDNRYYKICDTRLDIVIFLLNAFNKIKAERIHAKKRTNFAHYLTLLDVDLVRNLGYLRDDVDYEKVDYNGDSPLLHCVYTGNLPMFKYLIEKRDVHVDYPRISNFYDTLSFDSEKRKRAIERNHLDEYLYEIGFLVNKDIPVIEDEGYYIDPKRRNYR